MLNGRISGRSIRGYRRVMPFFRMVLSRFDLMSMIGQGDRTRIIEMGARPETVSVNGNAKYDMLIRSTTQGMNENIRRMLHIPPDAPVIVAGSIRTGEEEIILEAYKKIIDAFQDTVLIIAPRHLERIKELTELISIKGLKYHLRSELLAPGGARTEGIIIVDCFGDCLISTALEI
jgi:3-deoxy-D-manno-octulosonic-acid transferase